MTEEIKVTFDPEKHIMWGGAGGTSRRITYTETGQPMYPTWPGQLQPPHTTGPQVVMTPEQEKQMKDAVDKFNQKQLTEATKFDGGKTNWSLFPWDAAEEIIKVLEFGAGKYSPWNWAENGGFKFSRLFNSSMRHFIAWFWRKEDNDPETGISHLAHLGCNVLFLLHYVLNKGTFKNNDDRKV